MAQGDDRADRFVAGNEREIGHAPFVVEHGEVGMADSAVADLDLDFLGTEFTRIEAEGLKRGTRCVGPVSMEASGHLIGSPKS